MTVVIYLTLRWFTLIWFISRWHTSNQLPCAIVRGSPFWSCWLEQLCCSLNCYACENQFFYFFIFFMPWYITHFEYAFEVLSHRLWHPVRTLTRMLPLLVLGIMIHYICFRLYGMIHFYFLRNTVFIFKLQSHDQVFKFHLLVLML